MTMLDALSPAVAPAGPPAAVEARPCPCCRTPLAAGAACAFCAAAPTPPPDLWRRTLRDWTIMSAAMAAIFAAGWLLAG